MFVIQGMSLSLQQHCAAEQRGGRGVESRGALSVPTESHGPNSREGEG